MNEARCCPEILITSSGFALLATAAMMMPRLTVHGYGIGPLHLLIVAGVIIVPFWQIFSKAGYSGWLSFLMLLPFINLIALYVLAFSDWPALRKKAAPLT